MPATCDGCGNEIELVVSNVINHSGSKYTGGDGTFKLMIGAECGCSREKPQATELDSIEFSGNPPDGWK